MSEKPQLMYVAGRMVAESEATVSALDAGLMLGVGLFETLRTYNGRPFRLARHMARLRSSGRFFRIFLPGETDGEIAAVIARLLEANDLADARIRITATRGPVTEGLSDDEAPLATLLVTAGGQVTYPAELYERGAAAVVSDIRINESDPVVFHKTTNYMANLLAIRDAHSAGAAEALRFNTRNRLAEGAISNVFLVSGGRVATPPVEDGLLAGVTREAVLELAAECGIPAEQRSLTVDDMLGADEVFLTNSIMEVMPVVRIEKHEVGPKGDPDRLGRPGPITRRLAEAYKTLVTRETKA
ncbi:MAG: aminotransferase class IV [Planctomycetota bacterium]|nr:aminotransferase class IV [Planctomycetota bacterium]